MKGKLSKKDIADIIDQYNKGESQYSLSQKFKVSYGVIRYHLVKHNVNIRKGNQNKKYSLNDNYFDNINSHEKAYWLGFIAADGSITSHPKRGYYLSIALARRDKSHLVKLKENLQYTGEVRDYKSKLNGKEYPTSKLLIHSKKLVNDLISYNIVPNKTKELKLSAIGEKYYSSYILGFIDGDGCWYVSNNQIMLNVTSTKKFLIDL